jgi:hypothetical protein
MCGPRLPGIYCYILSSLISVFYVYNNKYALIIDIYFYEFFLSFKPRALALQNIWDTLSDVLYKCLCFSLIKIEPVSINPSQAVLSLFSFSVVSTFLLKCDLQNVQQQQNVVPGNNDAAQLARQIISNSNVTMKTEVVKLPDFYGQPEKDTITALEFIEVYIDNRYVFIIIYMVYKFLCTGDFKPLNINSNWHFIN